VKCLISCQFVYNFSTMQYNCILIECSLQCLEAHIKARQSLGFSDSKVWHTLWGGVLLRWCQSVISQGQLHREEMIPIQRKPRNCYTHKRYIIHWWWEDQISMGEGWLTTHQHSPRLIKNEVIRYPYCLWSAEAAAHITRGMQTN